MGFSLRRTIRRITRSVRRATMAVVTLGGSVQAEKQEKLAREQMNMEKDMASKAEADRIKEQEELREGQLGAFENQGSALGSLEESETQTLGGKKKKLSAL
ncbi:MAG: hypothetical protein ACRC6B_01315 [Fusobacteriaceae bacterium]